jgi:Heparinase II/III-like protein
MSMTGTSDGRVSQLGWYARTRAARRPSGFAGAGITLLRTSGKDEIRCRCNGGPHGYLGIAAPAYAHALSVEVSCAGVAILADPSIFRYHGGRPWRSYFRSTIAHNTAELGGRSQAGEGGPSMWARHAHTREIEVLDDGDIARWTAEYDGYASLDPPTLHRRSVLLDRASRSIDIIDQIDGGSHVIRLAFHLGPFVQAELGETGAVLDWPAAPIPGAARLELPLGLRWSLHRGETDPILGWYSHGLGRRVPAVTLLGCGRCVPGMPLITRLEFLEVGDSENSGGSRQAIS